MRKRYKEKICQIIPTKDRPREMRRLLESIRSQSCPLAQIVVVDGSDNPIEALLMDFPDLNITYVRKRPPSLIPQRNAGLTALAPEITLVGFLDDDIVLEAGCVEQMYEFWETAWPGVGGAEYNVVYDSGSVEFNTTGKLLKVFRQSIARIFLTNNSKKKGKILPSGFCVTPYPAEHTMRVSWLSGGCNVYRRHIFERFKFDDWYIGWGIGDDLEFSYRVTKEYELFIVAEARLQHLPLPTKPGKGYLCGKILAINQFHFVRKNPEFSLLLCAWASLGRALAKFCTGVLTFDINSLHCCAGYLVGIYQGLTGTLQPLNRTVK